MADPTEPMDPKPTTPNPAHARSNRQNAARWLAAPAAAVTIVGGVLVAQAADASPTLPERSAEQLLVDLQSAKPLPMSGTVSSTVSLGLPELPSSVTGGDTGLTSLIVGSNTARVWTDGEQRSRFALVAGANETNIVKDGDQVWQWSSRDRTATHYTVDGQAKADAKQQGAASAEQAPEEYVPKTPQEAAQQVLAKLDPTTAVTVDGTGSVAGRGAYQLVLTPRDAATRVGKVTISVDAEHHVPLRVQVDSTKTGANAIDVGFSRVSFAMPDANVFAFTPPPGATVVDRTGGNADGDQARDQRGKTEPGATEQGAESDKQHPQVVGEGWTAVTTGYLSATPPDPHGDARADSSDAPETGNGSDASGQQLQQVMESFPKVSGSWGAGRVLDGTLISAVITDDGRYAVGAVAPDALYQALPPAR